MGGMASRRERAQVWAWLLTAAMTLPAGAHAYPIARPGLEAPRLGNELQLQRGPWVRQGDAWGLGEVGGPRRYLLDGGPTPSFLRLRIDNATGADVALMYRARVTRCSPLRIEGYGVAVNATQSSLAFLRWDEGGVRDPGVTVQVPAMQGRTSLELALWIGGSNFSATLYDAQSKELLATLAWSDTAYSSGGVGLYAHPQQPTVARFYIDGPAERPVSGQRQWVSPTWTAYVAPQIWSAVPAPLRKQIVARQAPAALTEGASRLALMGTEIELRALQEAGVPLEDLHAGVPYRLRRYAQGLRDWQEIYAELEQLKARYSDDCELEEIGRSSEGRPIMALFLGNADPAAPSWLFNAAHHANEASTPEFVMDLVRYLLQHRREKKVRDWLQTFRIVAVPVVNPDGSHAFWNISDEFGRKNRRPIEGNHHNLGVDLNRNYPFRWGGPEARYDTDVPGSDFYRGPAPASEPEVQAMVRLAEQERFVGAVSYHAAATRLLVPYTIPGVEDPEPSVPWALAAELIAGWSPLTARKRYQAVRALYPVSGTEQDWYFHRFGTLAYLLEIPYRRARGEKLTQSIVHARHLWQSLFARWRKGPALSVQVVRPAGAGVKAAVRVKELELRAEERWYTHAEHGWLHQFLPRPGTYTVEIEAEGQRLVREVVVGNEPAELTVELGDTSDTGLVAGSDALGQQ